MIQLAAGQFLLAGSIYAESYRTWLLCLSEHGEELWFQEYQTGSCHSVLAAADGGYILAGSVQQPGHKSYDEDGWIMKTDSAGNECWRNVYGVEGFEQWDYTWEATLGTDGRIALAGESGATGAGAVSAWVVIVDSTGSLISDKRFAKGGDTHVYHIDAVPDGGFLLNGGRRDSEGSNPEHFLMMINGVGDSLWYRDLYRDWNELDPIPNSYGTAVSFVDYMDAAAKNYSSPHIQRMVYQRKLATVENWLKANENMESMHVYSAGPLNNGCFMIGTFIHPFRGTISEFE